MAYTPINWQTGDTITAEKMNKMDNGWGVSSTQLFSETVTTTAGDMGNSAVLSYTEGTFPYSMDITFDSTKYTCPRQSGGGQYWYGAPNPSDWSIYPFVLLFMNERWTLVTQTAGTHTVSVATEQLEVSANFSTAVGECMVVPMFTDPDGLGTNVTCNMTYAEISEAIRKRICFYAVNDLGLVLTLDGLSNVSFSMIWCDSTQGITQVKYTVLTDDSIIADVFAYPSN